MLCGTALKGSMQKPTSVMLRPGEYPRVVAVYTCKHATPHCMALCAGWLPGYCGCLHGCFFAYIQHSSTAFGCCFLLLPVWGRSFGEAGDIKGMQVLFARTCGGRPHPSIAGLSLRLLAVCTALRDGILCQPRGRGGAAHF